MWLQRGADVRLARAGFALEQRLGAHHHAGDAVAALRGLRLDEGLLHRSRFFRRAEAFDRADLASLEDRDRRDAGEDRLAVGEHRAGAALAEAAAELGAVQAQILAQHVEERRRAVGLHLVHAAVYIELSHQSPREIFFTSPATSRQAGWPLSARR